MPRAHSEIRQTNPQHLATRGRCACSSISGQDCRGPIVRMPLLGLTQSQRPSDHSPDHIVTAPAPSRSATRRRARGRHPPPEASRAAPTKCSISARRLAGLAGLNTTGCPLARASAIASVPDMPVTNAQIKPGPCSDRRRSATCTPLSPPARSRSHRTTSGRRVRARSTASSPPAAVVTSQPHCASSPCIPSRAAASSSTTSTRTPCRSSRTGSA